MYLRGIISSKYKDIQLRQINGIGMKSNKTRLEAIRSEETGSQIRAELFQDTLAISYLGLLWLFLLHLLQTKRLISWILKMSSFCHFTLSSIMDRQNRWLVSAPHQPPPFTWIMWGKPKVARVMSLTPPPYPLWSPCWPEGPSPQARVAPAGTAEPLAREGMREKRRGGGAELQNIISSPQSYPSTLYPIPVSHPLSLLTLPPSIDTRSSCCVCVYMCLCPRLHMCFSGGCQRKMVCF